MCAVTHLQNGLQGGEVCAGLSEGGAARIARVRCGLQWAIPCMHPLCGAVARQATRGRGQHHSVRLLNTTLVSSRVHRSLPKGQVRNGHGMASCNMGGSVGVLHTQMNAVASGIVNKKRESYSRAQAFRQTLCIWTLISREESIPRDSLRRL